jgi:hypothetical protein
MDKLVIQVHVMNSNLSEPVLNGHITRLAPLDQSADSIINEIYSALFLVIILTGVVVNLIVIVTYRYGDKGKMLTNNTSTNAANFAHKIISFRREDTPTDAFNQLSSQVHSQRRTSRHSESMYTKIVENNRKINRKASGSLVMVNQSRVNNRHNSVDCIDTLNRLKTLRKYSTDINNNSSQQLFYPVGGQQSLVPPLNYTNNNSSIRRTLCSYFIISLGICDLFICSVNMPLKLLTTTTSNQLGDVKLNTLGCKLAYFLLQMPITLEIEILLMIAIDRYSSVFRSIDVYFFDKKKFKFILLAQICLSALFSLPNVYFYEFNYSLNESTTENITVNAWLYQADLCTVRRTHSALYALYQLVLFALFTSILLVIMICYMKVYKHVYKASKKQRRESLITNNTLSIHGTATVENDEDDEGVFRFKKYLTCFPRFGGREEKNAELDKSRKEEPDEAVEMATNGKAENTHGNAYEVHTLIDAIQEEPAVNNHTVSTTTAGAETVTTTTTGCEVLPKQQTAAGKSRCQYMRSYSIGPSVNFEDDRESKYSRGNGAAAAAVATVGGGGGSSSRLLMDRLRRFSENHVFQHKASTAHSSLFELSNTMSIRRHTSRRFKHGRTARVLGLTTLGFAITWIPYWVCLYKTTTKTTAERLHEPHDTAQMSLAEYLLVKYIKNSFYLNYILNPIFYSFVNQRFRKIFVNLLKKLLRPIVSRLSHVCCCCCFGLLGNKNVYFFNSNNKTTSSNLYCSSASFSSSHNHKRNGSVQQQHRRNRVNSTRSEVVINSSSSSSSNNNGDHNEMEKTNWRELAYGKLSKACCYSSDKSNVNIV